ncbi:hypothetical protein ACSHT2_25620 [Bradyrhizobium sp. PUT101]|uniref:hypothetical protein n=1 Tax=unclassified Bradyrhizobium TaxID=2631580 RepID=UPI001EF7B7C3|nr:hypothetical protein [Bradyrhizobium sp. I71]ULK95646.1 hypothetical protein FJV43_23025 [Bradyrhizobium sp. I71]
MEARLVAAVDALPNAFALSAAERQETLAGIEAELLQSEREEESLITLSEAADSTIMRRVNADAPLRCLPSNPISSHRR